MTTLRLRSIMFHFNDRQCLHGLLLSCLFFFSFVIHVRAQCNPGFFNPPGCSSVCHCKSGYEVCDVETGMCGIGICSPGWVAPPFCQTECAEGWFGVSCNLYCHCPLSDECDNINGLCTSGKCQRGWTGPSCQIGLPLFSGPPNVTHVTTQSITIQWRQWSLAHDVGHGPIYSYKLQMQMAANTRDEWQDVVEFEDIGHITYSYVVSALSTATLYRFRLVLVALVGGKPQLSDPSPSTSPVTTRCGEPTSGPTKIFGKLEMDDGAPSLRMSWQRPPKKTWKCHQLVRYEGRVKCKPDCGSCVFTTPITRNYARLSKLPLEAEITISVRVINSAGLYGPWSTEIKYMVDSVQKSDSNMRKSESKKNKIYFLFEPSRDNHCPSTTFNAKNIQIATKPEETESGGEGGAIYIDGVGVSPWYSPNDAVLLPEENEKQNRSIVVTVIVITLVAAVLAILIILLLVWRHKKSRESSLYRKTCFQSSFMPDNTPLVQSPFTDNVYKPATGMRMLDHNLRQGVQKQTTSSESPCGDRKSIPVLTRDLSGYIKQRQSSSFTVEEEFRSLSTNLNEDTAHTGKLATNSIYNRSQIVVPYDRNRVKLDKDGIYINASLVKSVNHRLYIVTQAPLADTITDFWLMVWEQRVNIIIMLMDTPAPQEHNAKLYWPNEGEHEMGDMRVIFIKEERTAHYTMRIFEMSYLGHTDLRVIHHFQYRKWLPGGLPLQSYTFLDFVNRIHHEKHPKFNVIVHCQTGGGRSGMFIAIDSLLQEGRRAGKVDILRCISTLRSERPDLVHSARQYLFVHESLAEAFDHADTNIPATKFNFAYNNILNSNSNNCRIPLACEFYDLQNKYSSRQHDPWQESSIFVSPAITADSFTLSKFNSSPNGVVCKASSLCAMFADSYSATDAFLLVESPPPDSYANFWGLLYENQVRTIVMLDAECPDYLPHNEGEDIRHDQLCLLLRKKTRSHDNLLAYDLGVSRIQRGSEHMRHIKLFKFTGWPSERMAPSPSASLALLLAMEEWLRASSMTKFPIAVHGGKSLSHPGLLVALWHLYERSNMQAVVDVYSTVRYIRDIIHSAVPDLAQYCFLHETMTLYLRHKGISQTDAGNSLSQDMTNSDSLLASPGHNSTPIPLLV